MQFTEKTDRLLLFGFFPHTCLSSNHRVCSIPRFCFLPLISLTKSQNAFFPHLSMSAIPQGRNLPCEVPWKANSRDSWCCISSSPWGWCWRTALRGPGLVIIYLSDPHPLLPHHPPPTLDTSSRGEGETQTCPFHCTHVRAPRSNSSGEVGTASSELSLQTLTSLNFINMAAEVSFVF